jgi:uncharacterized protein YcbK (DUF882 family)
MMREKISKHFYRDEYECKCGCEFDVVDIELNKIHEDIREYFGVPVTINSACRCKNHNMAVGGSQTSQHLLGKAGDTVVNGVTPLRIYQYLDVRYPDALGLGLYDTFVHIDSRKRKARWGDAT